MPSFSRSVVLATASLGLLVPAAAPAQAAANYTFRHGLYQQSHSSTLAACEKARTSAISTIKKYKGTSIKAGACHRIDAGTGAGRQTGYLYDVSYNRARAIWNGDTKLGVAPAPLIAGAHSFKVNGSYSTKAEAETVEKARVASLQARTFGAKVTWRSGVKLNAVTKKWQYEIDYNSRVPLFSGHIEISQKPNVTSPSLGVVKPIPTNPTTDATTGGTTVVTPPSGDVTPSEPTSVAGIDISGHTVLSDWAGWKEAGVAFLYTKATEGDYYKNPKFASQYTGAYDNGIIRGAYHFANPSSATGAQQADFFVSNGGGWSNDGKTLPGALDMEWNPYGSMCFDMTQTQMRTWINDFVTQYRTRTGVNPMIYTASIWWNRCVGTDASAAGSNGTLPQTGTTQQAVVVRDSVLAQNPLWLARYSSSVGPLPTMWSSQNRKHAIWQNAALDAKGYDTNIFNGSLTQLRAYATTGKL